MAGGKGSFQGGGPQDSILCEQGLARNWTGNHRTQISRRRSFRHRYRLSDLRALSASQVKMKRVCVIGAGVVGCATAYQLAKDGYAVTLIDEAEQAGSGTSFANGAQLSYSYIAPFASPKTLKAIPQILLRKSRGVTFTLRKNPTQWMWCLQFLAACRASEVERHTAALWALGQQSRQALEAWIRKLPRQVDSSEVETSALNTRGLNRTGGTSPRDSCGRHSL